MLGVICKYAAIWMKEVVTTIIFCLGLHSHHIPALKDLIAKTSIMSSELCTNQTLHLLKVCYEVVGLQQLSDTSWSECLRSACQWTTVMEIWRESK